MSGFKILGTDRDVIHAGGRPRPCHSCDKDIEGLEDRYVFGCLKEGDLVVSGINFIQMHKGCFEKFVSKSFSDAIKKKSKTKWIGGRFGWGPGHPFAGHSFAGELPEITDEKLKELTEEITERLNRWK